MFELRNRRIFVAGHNGMVGSALVRRLAQEGCEILTASRQELDLTQQAAVAKWMDNNRPDVIYLAAAKVGGILANDMFPAEFLYENLMIEANVIQSAYRFDVSNLIFLGSTCVYPKFASQPIREDSLLSGALEPTNEWYAIAKIAGIKLAQAFSKQYDRKFISVQPTNLYGPGDNYDPTTSHVLAALLRKAHEGKRLGLPEIVVWGSGEPLREFLHVDDLADALVFVSKSYSSPNPINIGLGAEVSIFELAKVICEIVGFRGHIVFDRSKPDGAPRKLADSSKLHQLGWNGSRDLKRGISETYESALRAGNLI